MNAQDPEQRTYPQDGPMTSAEHAAWLEDQIEKDIRDASCGILTPGAKIAIRMEWAARHPGQDPAACPFA